MLAHVAVHAPHPKDRNQMSGFWGRNLSSQMNRTVYAKAVHIAQYAAIRRDSLFSPRATVPSG